MVAVDGDNDSASWNSIDEAGVDIMDTEDAVRLGFDATELSVELDETLPLSIASSTSLSSSCSFSLFASSVASGNGIGPSVEYPLNNSSGADDAGLTRSGGVASSSFSIIPNSSRT